MKSDEFLRAYLAGLLTGITIIFILATLLLTHVSVR